MIDLSTHLISVLFENYGALAIMAFFVFLMSIALGRVVSLSMDEYQSLAKISASENNLGFNAVYRIVIAPVSIVFLSIILFLSGNNFLTNNIWAVAIWYFIYQTVFLTLLARWGLVEKFKYFCFHILSITLSVFIYSSLIVHGIDRLLPDEANLRTDLWLIIVAFIYGLFRNAKSNNVGNSRKQNAYIRRRAKYFSTKYESALNDYSEGMQKILLAIMIYEDFNRPRLIRILERTLKSKTQGIMQTSNAKNDVDSIQETAERIKPLFDSILDEDVEYILNEKLTKIFSSHNPQDNSYGWDVLDVYRKI